MPNQINVDDLIGYFKRFASGSSGVAPTREQKQRAISAAGPQVYQQARQQLMGQQRQQPAQQQTAQAYPPAMPVGVAPNRYDNRQPAYRNQPAQQQRQLQRDQYQQLPVSPRFYAPAGTAYTPPGEPVGLMPSSNYYVLQGQPGPVYYDRNSGRPVPASTIINNSRGV